jgi:predicted transglutaminase-like cysteine proteinase
MQQRLGAELRKAVGVLSLTISLVLGTVAPILARTDQDQPTSVRLFGTVEFRTSLKALPRWERIRERAARQMVRLAEREVEALPRAIRQWREMLMAAREMSEMEQLKTVNRFFNRWPYRLDREVYGAPDHWATPEEFMIHSGDCEDYGIAKYFSLRQLGLPAARLRLVVVRDRIRGIGHAVLAVYLGQAVYILDNLTDQVLPHRRYRHYRPQYSVNETHAWAHLPAKSRTTFSNGAANGRDNLGKDP